MIGTDESDCVRSSLFNRTAAFQESGSWIPKLSILPSAHCQNYTLSK